MAILYQKPPETDERKSHIIINATDNTTVIDTNDIYTNDYTKEFQITTADADGNKIKQTRTAISGSVTVDTTGAARAEIAPVYSYQCSDTSASNYLDINDLRTDTKLSGKFECGSYNFTFAQKKGKSLDIYVNDAMIGNNVYYTGYLRKINDTISYSAHDISIGSSGITLTIKNVSSSTDIDTIEIVKSPSIVNRTKKIWIIGDSLVQKYYGDLSASQINTTDKNRQCGWGQFLANYLTDDIEVINLAKAGDYTENLYFTAFTGVKAYGKKDDIVLIEGGYNDFKSSTKSKFETMITNMYNEAKDLGLIPVLVSPNCSMTIEKINSQTIDDYSADLRFAPYIRTLAENNNWNFIDLAKLSYDFYSKTYGTDANARENISNTYFFPASLGEKYNSAELNDILHHNEYGGQKWASIIVQELFDKRIITINEVDFTNVYAYTDTVGNNFNLKVSI
ncbi:MAG: hypothetical protein HFE51_04310 [Clostridia bacterium]|nr:hypothetical protein [Clostridia bacterium]